MNKEKLLQLISDALDKGGSISLFVSQFDQRNQWKPVTKDEAHSKIGDFAEALGAKKIESSNRSYTINTENVYVACSYAADHYLAEDVDLSGGEQYESA